MDNVMRKKVSVDFIFEGLIYITLCSKEEKLFIFMFDFCKGKISNMIHVRFPFGRFTAVCLMEQS